MADGANGRGPAVVDAPARKTIWNSLLPGATLLSAEDDGLLKALRSSPPSTLIIYANCAWQATTEASRLAISMAGTDLACRLRQEPEEFPFPILLASFEQAAALASRSQALAELLGARGLSGFVRLPADQFTIQSVVSSLEERWRENSGREASLREPAKSLCRHALRVQEKIYRHRQGQFRAAVRLILGGIEAGDVAEEPATKALAEIERRRGADPERSTFDFDVARRYLRLIGSAKAREDTGGHHSGGRRPRLLVVDDQFESAGWDVAFSVLLPEWECTGAKRPSEVKQDDLSGLTLALVDRDLGNDGSGLDLVDWIRGHSPFLPIVMFTRSDDSYGVSEAINRGCNEYFVKELEDTSDRESLDYYHAMRRMFGHFRSLNVDARSHLQQAWDAGVRPWADLPETAWRLRKVRDGLAHAIFYATYAWGLSGSPRSNRRTDGEGAARAAGIHVGHAIEKLVECLADRDLAAGGFSSAVNSLDGHALLGVPIRSVWQIRRSTSQLRHGGVIDPSTVLKHIGEIASWFQSVCENKGCVRREGRRMPGGLPPLGRDPEGAPRGETHQQRSVHGAARFLIGALLRAGHSSAADLISLYNDPECLDADSAVGHFSELVEETAVGEPAQDPSLVLLVDDTADKDGWTLALRRGLPQHEILHLRYQGQEAEARQMAALVDVVLLDLKLPEKPGSEPRETVGWDLLKRLREPASGARDVPVVVFSGEDGALWTQRCFLEGAQGYFPKTGRPLPRGAEADQREFFTDYHTRLVLALEGAETERSEDDIRGLALRVGREQRYRCLDCLPDGRSLLDNLDIASESSASRAGDFARFVSTQLTLICELVWTEHDPHKPALWRAISVERGEEEAGAAGVVLFLSGLLETVLRLQLNLHDPTLNTRGTLFELTTLARQHRLDGPWDACLKFNRLRKGKEQQQPAERLRVAIQLAAEAVPGLCDQVALGACRRAHSLDLGFDPTAGADLTLSALQRATDQVKQARTGRGKLLRSALQLKERTARFEMQVSERVAELESLCERTQVNERLMQNNEATLAGRMQDAGRRGRQIAADYERRREALLAEGQRLRLLAQESRKRVDEVSRQRERALDQYRDTVEKVGTFDHWTPRIESKLWMTVSELAREQNLEATLAAGGHGLDVADLSWNENSKRLESAVQSGNHAQIQEELHSYAQDVSNAMQRAM